MASGRSSASDPLQVGRICKVTQSFNLRIPSVGQATFKEGELCTISRINGPSILLWRRHHPSTPVWVDVENLKQYFEASKKTLNDPIHVEVRYDMTDLLLAPQTGSIPAPTPAANIVRCMKEHLETWVRQRRFLEQTPEWLWPLISDSQRINGICQDIADGIGAVGSKDVLFNKDFNLDDIDSLPEVQHQTFRGLGGVYIIIYSQVKDKGSNVYVYIGSTNDFYTRWAQHTSYTKDEKRRNQSRHYQIAHGAKYKTFRVLCGVQKWKGDSNPVDAFHYRLIAEQLFIGVFGAYRPDSIAAGKRGRWGNKDSVAQNISSQGSNVFPSDVVFDRLDDLLDMDGFAASWDRVGQQANTKAQWTPAVARPSFKPKPSISAIEGLNKQSPVSTHSSFVVLAPMMWYRTHAMFPGGKSGFNFERTTRCKLTHNYQSTAKMDAEGKKQKDEKGPLFVLAVQNKIGKEHLDFSISAKGSDVPKAGQMVSITFEVIPNGIHETSFSGLPLIGPFLDWKDALSIAFRISWQDDQGAQKMMYGRRQRVLQLRPGASGVGALSGYLVGRAMLRYLSRQAINRDSKPKKSSGTQTIPGTNHFRLGDYDLALARVKDANFDFFNRSITIRDLPVAASVPIPSSQRKIPADLRREMEAAGLTNIGMRLKDLPQNFRRELTQGRVACDHCMIVRMLSGGYQKCDPIPLADAVHADESQKHHFAGLFSCTGYCAERGLPCSWTSHQGITPKEIQSWTEAQKWNPPNRIIANIAKNLYRQSIIPGVQVGFDRVVEINQNDPEGTSKAQASDSSIKEQGLTEEEVIAQEAKCAAAYEDKMD